MENIKYTLQMTRVAVGLTHVQN